jgi:integrase
MALVEILTGLRVAEILGLRWADVDFASAEIRVSQRCYRGEMDSPKTRSSRRTLPLCPMCMDALRKLQKQSGPRENAALVFQTSKGTPYSDTDILHRHLKPPGQKIAHPG